MDPDLVIRIDVSLALLALALLVARFHLVAVNFIIGIIRFVVVVSTVGAGSKGYRESSAGADETAS
ncbi:hypothetical protein BRC94_01205 [Halobacteriales archaeon QS_5_70_17]|nr:MAG: hypothetical protein BRC94_01205 [Halobacteriales archaeon QS_5_70_17]